PISRTREQLSWIYLHLPVTMGIAAVGASILNVVEHSGETLPREVRMLLVVAIAAVLVSIAMILKSLKLPESLRRAYRTGAHVMFISGLLILFVGLTLLSAIPLLLLLVVLMLAPVLYSVLVWIKVFDARELEM
ncbi:MAG TPA: low temperature requirement protein A, partial [Anaerolineales bacterium]|nr:low temperature requirement protein A [Anaerolineales bacterium]